MFQIGQKVIIRKSTQPKLIGKVGIVRGFSDEDLIAVEFDFMDAGLFHSCGGRTQILQGYYVTEDMISKYKGKKWKENLKSWQKQSV